MLCESDIRVSWRARPRGFIALMGLYESNYLRLRRLVEGEPAQLRGLQRSQVAGDCELQLEVIEHMSYTSTLSLTYLLPGPPPDAAGPHALFERQPDLQLRVYHDARLLEAGEFRTDHRSAPARRAAASGERELHQRWVRNMMLNKWLEYCAERGHRFRR